MRIKPHPTRPAPLLWAKASSVFYRFRGAITDSDPRAASRQYVQVLMRQNRLSSVSIASHSAAISNAPAGAGVVCGTAPARCLSTGGHRRALLRDWHATGSGRRSRRKTVAAPPARISTRPEYGSKKRTGRSASCSCDTGPRRSSCFVGRRQSGDLMRELANEPSRI